MAQRGRGYLLISLITSLCVLLGANLWVLSWRSQLPDRVAIHWGASGRANGFSSLDADVALMSGIMGAAILLMFGLALSARKLPSAVRTLAATMVYLAFLGALIQVLTLGMQRGLSDAQQAELPGWVLVVSLLAPVVPAVLAFALAPKTAVPNATSGPGPDALTVALVNGRVPTWRGRTMMRPAGSSTLIGVLLFAGLWMGAALSWAWLAMMVVLSVLVAAMSSFNVTADEMGLRVQSWAKWPAKRIPVAKIQEARVVQVDPMGQFGGWGWRISFSGAEGVVMRKGPGVEVSYGDGSRFVVTLDSGEDECAGTLNTSVIHSGRIGE